MARALIDPASIKIFGSHARGQTHPNSDWDVAVLSPRHPENWSRFVLDLEEQAETLRPFDVVLYDEAAPSLRSQIDKEGIAIYEARQSIS